MKAKPWRTYLFTILPTLLGGFLAGRLSGSGAGYEDLVKPPLSPPAGVFPLVWTVLYLLMAIGMAMAWNAEPARAKPARNSYLLQLAVNLLWPFFFFRWGMRDFAAAWLLLLIVLVLAMLLSFKTLDATAARLNIPYLLWLVLAAWLNMSVYLLNK